MMMMMMMTTTTTTINVPHVQESNWNTSAPRQQLPLRIEVEGLSSVPSWGQGPSAPTTQPLKPRHFHHIYDFINYLPYISEDPDIFLVH